MSRLISDIINGNGCDEILDRVLLHIFEHGPVSPVDMETLSYLCLYQPALVAPRLDEILLTLGIFFKEGMSFNDIKSNVFNFFREQINEDLHYYYTPVQSSIVANIGSHQVFSFSAPTSTGKSFVIMNLIRDASCDVVVVVPSRALINEYFFKLCEGIQDKSVNILTHIDRVNTSKCTRSVFVVTPERCRDLFKMKDQFNVGIIFFDEAQLTNESNKRGLYFDSIVRRCQKAFPNARFVFAHPFVDNPGAQIVKNNFSIGNGASLNYEQRNIGQIFIAKSEERFKYFSIDESTKNQRNVDCGYDPIQQTIADGGSALFYVSKESLTNNSFLNKFSKYIDLCLDTVNPEIEKYISNLKEYTGGGTIANKNFYSQLLALMKRGVVVHHGSLPLEARLIVENYTKASFCRICFATSTLEQGINMPFDIVYIDRLESSKVLSVKNLIGRAGRSTSQHKFDIGKVVIESSKVSRFRHLLNEDIQLEEESYLDKNERRDDDYNKFKDAIVNDTFSDQFNLAEEDVQKLSAPEMNELLRHVLDNFFEDTGNVVPVEVIAERDRRQNIVNSFHAFFTNYLGRELSTGEKSVLSSALEILILRVHGRTFGNICRMRYAYVSNQKKRAEYEHNGWSTRNIKAKPVAKYQELPNRKLEYFIPLYKSKTLAKDVDYDRIVYDTYDYIDKCIGFYISDIIYAAFVKYYERTQDDRGLRFAKIVKFGTDDEHVIMMLRYGMSFEDVEKLSPYIDTIDETGLTVKQSFYDLEEEVRKPIERFV